MGTSQSKLSASPSLDELSVDDISSFVTGLGAKYEVYGEAIMENAVDGEVLASLDVEKDAEAVKETFECLEITNFLHRRVLTKEWKKARAAMMDASKEGTKITQGQTPLTRSETSYTQGSVASDLTVDTAEMTADPSSAGSSRRGSSIQVTDQSGLVGSDEPDGPPLAITLEQKQVLAALELPQSIDLLPVDSEELDCYRQTAIQVQAGLHSNMSAVNLLSLEGDKGVNCLSSQVSSPDGHDICGSRMHFDQPEDREICRRFILGSNEDFHVEDIPLDVSKAFGMEEPARYYGYVVKHGNLRVGTVCAIVQESPGKTTTTEEKKNILKFLAKETERQLERRKVLLQRNLNLKHDIELLKMSQEGDIIAPAHGPLRAVLASEVSSRRILFPYPLEPELTSEDGCPTKSEFTRRSATLSSWLGDKQANDEERSHLGPAYSDAFEQGFPPDKTPVGKGDMERVAMLNSLSLLEIDPLSEEANSIQSLVNMAGTLLDADMVFVNLMDHQYRYIFFPTFVKDPGSVSSKTRMYLEQTHETIDRKPDGSPFCIRAARATSICNYTIMSPGHQAFVVHDVSKDESLYPWKTLVDVGFYGGAPIVVRGQAVAGICVTCKDPRPDFGRVQEVQLEQFANLIAQQFESWALSREMRKLERERRLLLGNCLTSGHEQTTNSSVKSTRVNQPEEYAALIFTDVHGSQALQEANPDAMDTALAIHHRIIRTIVAENGGYEVSAEGSSFHLAFADVVDAVSFCLQAQEALHKAPWTDDILSLPEACEDASGSFRGLRVRMAVHCGEVDSAKNQLSGRVAYTGETVHVAKSLERMSHGGQILLTSDVWNIVSHLLENTLQFPQVIDLGSHVIPTNSSHAHDGITTKAVLQLVPSSLSHDYLRSRRLVTVGEDVAAFEQAPCVQGRIFPSILTKKALGGSFHDAPFAGNTVAMVSVDTSRAETLVDNPIMLLAALSKRISTILAEEYPRGYQCQDFVIAFGEVSDAVKFGLAIQENLAKESVLDLSLKNCLKIGVQEGVFETMGPNPKTGKAEYVGNVAIGVARIAEATAPGCVYLGREATEEDAFMLQPVTNGFMQEFMGQTILKGIREEFSLFKCQPCTSWYDQVKDNRSGRCSLLSPWRAY